MALARPIPMILLQLDAGKRSLQDWTPQDSLRLAMVIGGFIVAVVALGTIILYIRKRMFAPESEMGSARTLMEELREMRKSGRMSEAEYEAARRRLAKRVAAEMKSEAAAPPSSYSPKLPRAAMPPPSSRKAPPGYDLTGEPLPKPPAPDASG